MVKTRPASWLDEAGGLFMGTNKALFMLMNSGSGQTAAAPPVGSTWAQRHTAHCRCQVFVKMQKTACPLLTGNKAVGSALIRAHDSVLQVRQRRCFISHDPIVHTWEIRPIQRRNIGCRPFLRNRNRRRKIRCLRMIVRLIAAIYSQFKVPPVWYSITRVSKKLRSFFRSIISLIHGKGLSS